MKKRRFPRLGAAALAWRFVVSLVLIITAVLFWNLVRGRSSPLSPSTSDQVGDEVYTTPDTPARQNENGNEDVGTGQNQGTPVGAADSDSTTRAESGETSDLDPDEEELSEAVIPAAGGFALYLPAEAVPMDQLPELQQIELAEEPLLSMADILWYDPVSHIIEITEAAAGRLTQLELPGRSFVAAVDRRPIYQGAFMAAYMSRSYDGVVILWPSMLGEERQLQIQLGYPGPDFFSGDDPRADAGILGSLTEAGKLRANE